MTTTTGPVRDVDDGVRFDMTKLLLELQRDHQRINDLEQEMGALKEALANERTMRRALSSRVDDMERNTP